MAHFDKKFDTFEKFYFTNWFFTGTLNPDADLDYKTSEEAFLEFINNSDINDCNLMDVEFDELLKMSDKELIEHLKIIYNAIDQNQNTPEQDRKWLEHLQALTRKHKEKLIQRS